MLNHLLFFLFCFFSPLLAWQHPIASSSSSALVPLLHNQTKTNTAYLQHQSALSIAVTLDEILALQCKSEADTFFNTLTTTFRNGLLLFYKDHHDYFVLVFHILYNWIMPKIKVDVAAAAAAKEQGKDPPEPTLPAEVKTFFKTNFMQQEKTDQNRNALLATIEAEFTFRKNAYLTEAALPDVAPSKKLANSKAKIKLAYKIVNFLAIISKPMETVLFGTEFSFNSDPNHNNGEYTSIWQPFDPLSLEVHLENTKDSKLKPSDVTSLQNALTAVKVYVSAWSDALTAKYKPKGQEKPLATINAKIDPKYFKLPFQAPILTYKDGAPTEFWVRISLDPACIELQTLPMTPKGLKDNYGAKLQADIFDMAASVAVKLYPDPSIKGGGGHLSIDAKSAFGRYPKVLAWFMYLYTETNGYWDAFDVDYINSPFFWQLQNAFDPMKLFPQTDGEQRGWKAYTKTVRKYVADLGGYVDPKTDQLADPRTTDEHYRAINLEHADARKENDDISTSARIEMRHYAAQVSFDEFMNQATDLCDLLIVSRIFALLNVPVQDYIGMKKSTDTEYGSTSPINIKGISGVKPPWLKYMQDNNEPTAKGKHWIYTEEFTF